MKNTLRRTSQDFLLEYIGIPYTKKDCWGLVKLFYEKKLQRPIQGVEYSYVGDKELIEKIVTKEKVNFTKVGKPEYGDIIVFRIYGFNAHIGIYLDEQRFLHTMEGKDSCLETFIYWSKRIEGYYRYDPN